MTPLCEIAKKFGTDKGGNHLIAGDTCHNYTPAYHALLGHRRFQVKNVLEIGVNYGCSLRMWEEYFPNAQIVGLDCNVGCLFNSGNIRCFAADQFNEASLMGAMSRIGAYPVTDNSLKFDLIVDDGSHFMDHQVFSANVLMPLLAKDGFYVIEDIDFDCQPELIASRIPYKSQAIPVGRGIGKAHCWDACPKCHGAEGEQLLVFFNG